VPKSTAAFTAVAAEIAAGDVMGGAQKFAGVGPAKGGELVILTTELLVEVNALQASEASYTLHLYNVTPPSALADNAAWDLPAGDRDAYLGSLSLGTPVDVGATIYVRTDDIKFPLRALTGDLWGYLETDATFTPTAVDRNVTLHTLLA
jgi:hypothetical protein